MLRFLFSLFLVVTLCLISDSQAGVARTVRNEVPRDGENETVSVFDEILDFISDLIFEPAEAASSRSEKLAALARSAQESFPARSALRAETVESGGARGLRASGFATGKAVQNNLKKKKSGRSAETGEDTEREAVVEQAETSAREAGEEDTLSTDDVFLSDIINFIMYVVDSLGGGNLVRSLDYEQAARMEALKNLADSLREDAGATKEEEKPVVTIQSVIRYILHELNSPDGANIIEYLRGLLTAEGAREEGEGETVIEAQIRDVIDEVLQNGDSIAAQVVDALEEYFTVGQVPENKPAAA